jgi:hypothetical protein
MHSLLNEVCPKTIRWQQDGFTLTMKRLPHNGERFLYHYELRDGDAVIFSGDQFGAPAACVAESNDTRATMRRRLIIDLLGFLALGDGDTDDEHFADYTPEQRAWRDSTRRAVLDLIRSDLEEQWGRR